MCPLPNYVSSIAFLIADPARAAMLIALADGRALPAGELAYAAGVTAQTASFHLAKLIDSGLLTVEKEGRHRYYRLAGADVALALEHLAAIRPVTPASYRPLSREAQSLGFARRCYDHLAGRLGVAVTQGLQDRGFIVPAAEKQFMVTQPGMAWFGRRGLDVSALKPTRRGLARQCLDWTERRHHLAGPLGVHFMAVLCASGWLRCSTSSRVIELTSLGRAGLADQLGISVPPAGI
ncbi:MAG TPA: helix-turn-helix transcriptional regulator [Burkholderiales bacterium]|nr:helix-turn-helix transcriptional regulator [Burkholderiales bacterium]